MNWIRARSRRDRWREEVSITSHEMLWIVLWFQTRADHWIKRAQNIELSTGLLPYAHRQAAMWERLKKLAIILFSKVYPDLSTVFGYRMIKQEVAGNEEDG